MKTAGWISIAHNTTEQQLYEKEINPACNLYAGLFLVFFNSLDKTLSMREIRKFQCIWKQFA